MAETTMIRDPEPVTEGRAPCVHRERVEADAGPCEVCAEIARMIESGEVPF